MAGIIGPHEGRELAFMLAGTKKLALFHDAVFPDTKISEDIIPEKAFAPSIQNGEILRFAKDIHNTRKGGILRFVCYTLPEETWRAEFVLWLKQEWLEARLPHTPAHDALIGRLLGYHEQDIAVFLRQSSKKLQLTHLIDENHALAPLR